jgi:hypothetical protein
MIATHLTAKLSQTGKFQETVTAAPEILCSNSAHETVLWTHNSSFDKDDKESDEYS